MVEIAVYIYMVDKATGNIALVCERVYASVIVKKLGLNNNLSADTYNGINNLSVNEIAEKDITHLKIKFGIDNIPIKNHQLLDI